ncbi:MAG: hypothetical protein AAGA85_10965 [Bacteroidota bacterium]
MQVYQDQFYIVDVDPSNDQLSFIWKKGHPEVDHERFVAACCNFIGYGFEYRSDKILIDTLNFDYTPTPEFYAWQKTKHHDRYRKLGIQRVAYVLHEEYVAQMNNMPQDESSFVTRYFANTTSAEAWLNQ